MPDIYVERENGIISLEEWKKHIGADKELTLAEEGQGIHPITKSPLRFRLPGRALWNSSKGELYEIMYVEGKIGCEGGGAELTEKLFEIANALSASVFDCGEKIEKY